MHMKVTLKNSLHMVYQMRVQCILPRYKYCLFFSIFLYTDEDHIGRNICIKICTEIRSDYHPLLCFTATSDTRRAWKFKNSD